ncbi:MAG: hypothetical protein K1Y36_10245 [Blastocatellia bacterium]|nr:hypothetical protein [Blastocatellia bacterium]
MRFFQLRWWFFALLVAAVAFQGTRWPVVAQEKPADPLGAALTKNAYPLTVEGGKLTGAGADVLHREAKAAQFVLLGEDHGMTEMPQLTAMLFEELAPAGFEYFASEIGPLSARHLEKVARGPNSTEALATMNKQYPFGIPFYFWKEECAMVQAIGSKTRQKTNWLWGLDQEFILSANFHFERLVELTRKTKAEAVVQEMYQPLKTEFAHMVESKNPASVFMASARPEDFDRLEKALEGVPNPAVAEIFRELKVSWEVYLKNAGNQGYASNTQRSKLMKQHFMDYYKQAYKRDGKLPKVLFKFGMMHTKRGRSWLNVYDMGNLAAELAASNGSQSLHVVVVGAGGATNGYFPFVGNEADKKKPYNVVEEMNFFDVKPLLAAAQGKNWTLLDLRPLRPLAQGRKLGKIDPRLEEFIWGYDMAIVIPEIHASTLFE